MDVAGTARAKEKKKKGSETGGFGMVYARRRAAVLCAHWLQCFIAAQYYAPHAGGSSFGLQYTSTSSNYSDTSAL